MHDSRTTAGLRIDPGRFGRVTPFVMSMMVLAAALAHGHQSRLGADAQIATLEAMVRSVNAGNAASYARLYDPAAHITIYGGDALNGRAAIEQYEVGLLRDFPGTTLAFISAWHRGEDAVVHYGVNGKASTGRAMGHEGLLFFRFNASGLIEEERRYLDSLTPMAQLGALGPVPARALPVLPAKMTSDDRPSNAEAVALAGRIVEAINAADSATFLASLSDDIVIDELMCLEPFAGKAGAKRWFDMWQSAAPGATTLITRSIGVGQTVLIESVTRGALKGALGPVAGDGAAFEVHRALVLQMKEGRLGSLKAFTNGKEFPQAMRR